MFRVLFAPILRNTTAAYSHRFVYGFGMLVHWSRYCLGHPATPIHNILSTVPQLSISQKTLGTLPEDVNVMPKHVGATIHNE
jgi:hypothetical protein